MPHSRSRFGTLAENYAAVYLASQGYRVLEHNVRTPVGELDLVARKGREVVFVEVKARSTHAYGSPEESVNRAKQRHLIRSAQAYMAKHRALRGSPYRIDVIAITWRGDAEPEVVHIPNAVGEI
ncbi:MAG: YraN family protein [bacterium]|nr:YraN family protein [bacterium]